MEKTQYGHAIYVADPLNDPESIRLREKLMSVYTIVQANAYFVSNDKIKIQTERDAKPYVLTHLPAAFIAGMLVNRSSTMLEGSPGVGKTNIVKIMARLMTGSSINDPDNVVYCDDEMTKEKWMAFPDVKAMIKPAVGGDGSRNDGTFDVIWAPFFKVEHKGIVMIIDEINRANPRTQNELLSLMAEGIAQYAVPARVKVHDFRLFFTENPLDETTNSDGIYPLYLAFKDRIIQYIPVPSPSTYAMEMVSSVRDDERNYEVNLDDNIEPIMTVDEVRMATILASRVPVTRDAERYASYISRSLSLCLRSPGYDKTLAKGKLPGRDLCSGCHFSGKTEYHCDKYYGGSMRVFKDLLALARAYAFFLGIERVTEYLVKSVAMDVVPHRVLILPEKLRDDAYGGDKRKYLENYLFEWCWTLLQTRKESEEAYYRLYHGKRSSDDGTVASPEKDLQTIILNAQNDIYVRVDLLPLVMEIDATGDQNLKERKVNIMSSVNTNEYRQKALEIFMVQSSGASIKDKIANLTEILDDIVKQNIPFSSNLIDMIYKNYVTLQKQQKKERFLKAR